MFGTAKATQEADNVFIVQYHPTENTRMLEVKKVIESVCRVAMGPTQMQNRFDGDTGAVPFIFDKASGRVVEASPAVRISSPLVRFRLQLCPARSSFGTDGATQRES